MPPSTARWRSIPRSRWRWWRRRASSRGASSCEVSPPRGSSLSLSERNRLRARAMLASVRTDGAAAAEALGRIIQLDSTDLEAWDLLSYCHLVYGWQYGKSERDAREAAERVLQLDPTFVPG